MSATRGTLAEALNMIDLQLATDSYEVSLPRDAAVLVACALHDLLTILRDAGWTGHKTTKETPHV